MHIFGFSSFLHDFLDSRIVSVILFGETHERMIEIVFLLCSHSFLTWDVFSRIVPRTQSWRGTGEMKYVLMCGT